MANHAKLAQDDSCLTKLTCDSSVLSIILGGDFFWACGHSKSM